jgi:uncharacterized protein
MDKIRLGKTNLMVTRSGFGAIPIQRISFDESKYLLRKAYDNGINFFDTARAYSDSEEKIGYALSDVRKNIVIATKSGAADKETVLKDIDTSLKNMKTDYIDIFQIHNPKDLPDPDDPNGAYAALADAKKQGKIRFIGLTNHRIGIAFEAVESGFFDTLQFPFSCLSAEKDIKLVELCKGKDVGFIAMKALSGGLITNAVPTFAFLRQYDNVVPIWGIQREKELDEFISLEKNPPVLDEKMLAEIQKDRNELSGSFCRGCGYCLPCPAGIPISMAARISFFLTRSPYKNFVTEEYKKQMLLINDCINCGSCKMKCPYHLDTPKLLKGMLAWYLEFYEEKHNEISNLVDQ